jgi:hypothetical protein
LRDVFDHVAAAKKAADYVEDSRAVTADERFKGILVAGEAPSYNVVFRTPAASLFRPFRYDLDPGQ